MSTYKAEQIRETDDAVFGSVVRLTERYGWPPSMREIAADSGHDLTTVHRSLHRLARSRRIVKGPGPRMLKVAA